MAKIRHPVSIAGLGGVLCLGASVAVRLAPQYGDQLFGDSVAGKLTFLGVLLAAVVLPTLAAIRGSKWWLLVTAAAAATLADFYFLVSRVMR